ncbi:MAG TPA: hypothetical protein VMC79_12000, partial [Rectinemataceae bacterium]|nr:hypothetical protein [Rectinemataceae bacterium]
MNITDLADFYYRNQVPGTPAAGARGRTAAGAGQRPSALPQVQGTGASIADTSRIDKKSPLYDQCQQF